MNKTSKAATGEGDAPRVISDREVLHRASSEVWPRVTRVQEIEFHGKISTVNFWHNANGTLHHVN